jgi:hypothetical protein
MIRHSLVTVLRGTETDLADIQNLYDDTDPTAVKICTPSVSGRPLIPI